MTHTLTLPLHLYADIETIPSQHPAVRAEIDARHATTLAEIDIKFTVAPLDLSGITAAANLKDPAKIEADIEKRREKAIADHAAAVEKAAADRAAAIAKADADAEEEYRRTNFDATTGHIACISAALGGDDVFNVQNAALGLFSKPVLRFAAEGDPRSPGDTISIVPGFGMVLEDERDMLADFFDFVEGRLLALAIKTNVDDMPVPTVVAHHAQFDVRYIWQRAVILGVRVPDWWPIDAKPWDSDRIDTMVAWAGAKGTIGLDRLCRALGIEGKGDMDGSKVWDAVREGRINDVVSYCDGDVERLRAVHRRIRGLEEPKRAFENLTIGMPWTEADSELALAAEAVADAQATTGEEEDLPSFTDNVPSFGDGFRRGFNADGGSYNAVDSE